MLKRGLSAVATLGVAALILTGCAASAPAASGGDSGAPAFTDRGPITLAIGKISGGNAAQTAVDAWNKDHADEQVTLVELSAKSDAQRQQLFQNAQTKSDAYTVMALDGTLIAQFAANRWIEQLPKDDLGLDDRLPATVKTVTYRDNVYGVPLSTDAAMLYYRTDLLKAAGITEAPKTFAELSAACTAVKALPEGAGISCYAGQFDKYEGLTCNVSEIINTAGGSLLDDKGRPTVDTPEARKGLTQLVSMFKDGEIPAEAITYNEEAGRQAFLAGKLLFHRQWAYQYVSASASDGSSQVAGKFAVAPLPGFSADKGGASVLGGKNLVISAFGKNKATALDFAKFFGSAENQEVFLAGAGVAPTVAALYDDPKMLEKYPYLPTLKQSILTAVPRPAVANYDDVTAAIQDSAYAALSGTEGVDAALKTMQGKLEGLLK
ncbi:ABC transporter substrate-binding protein [Mycetocola tolaasinivorans]|uniref:ABC transporter substrate-binding protein n=1 Tax=Mycetocola tolaasinivorans TaxID=76635 RepID=A0A3L7A3B5_9MICO|nr:ABC transporter substrate-binding protein [Mycetocola tolaasinivorans]RLP74717.1 ABC transporter substrate-binding protein [Mycetocola tolaasinivorans]